MAADSTLNSLRTRRYLKLGLPLAVVVLLLLSVWYSSPNTDGSLYEKMTGSGDRLNSTYSSSFSSGADSAGNSVFDIQEQENSKIKLKKIYPNKEVADFADSVFVLMKTGATVIYERIPGHMLSTFKWFPHHQIYAEFDGTVLGQDVVDPIKFLPEKFLTDKILDGYRKRVEGEHLHYNWRRIAIQGTDGKGNGWDIDKYKNIPAFAHTYLNHPYYDWYFMMDADTLAFPCTLYEAAKNFDPNEAHLIGRDVGPQQFIHGGSGMLASRGLLKTLFDNKSDSLNAAFETGTEIIVKNCCGDDAFCRLAGEYPNVHKDFETFDDAHFFQGAKPHETKANPTYWCLPIGTFHHVEPYHLETLSSWYHNKLLQPSTEMSPTNYDFFVDFVLPYLAEELPGWRMHFKIEVGFLGFVDNWYGEGTKESETKHSCKKACEAKETCMSWCFHRPGNCELIHEGIVPPIKIEPHMPEFDAKNKDTMVSGYMLDRIRRKRAEAPCDPYDDPSVPDPKEGAYLRQTFDYTQYKQGISIFD